MLTIKDIFVLSGRFLFTLGVFASATVHTLMYAVPEANKPAVVTASIAAALFIAMFDSGVFETTQDSDFGTY